MPGPGNLANYPELVKLWILEENIKLPLYKMSTIPKETLNIAIFTNSYSSHPSSRKIHFAADTYTFTHDTLDTLCCTYLLFKIANS